jgi:hypothetical protein
MRVWLSAHAIAAAGTCSEGSIEQASAVRWRGELFSVCERTPHGDLTFVPAAAGGGATQPSVVIGRAAVPLFNSSANYANLTAEAVASSAADVMGNALLAIGRDATLRDLQTAIPPLVLVNGLDFNDPMQCQAHGQKSGCKAYSFPGGVHTFVGSRSSSADIVFDTLGSDLMSEGHPSMNQFIHKYGLSMAIFKDPIEPEGQLEGLWGDHLPIFSYWWPMTAGGWIEYTVVPVADMDGSMEQDAYFRVQKVAPNGTVIRAQYYDNYAYTAGAFQAPQQVPASGEPPNSVIANEFYAAVLEQRAWWAAEFAKEGMMGLELPANDATSGKLLQSMMRHGVIRDMITRKSTFFPKYGVLPNGYSMPEVCSVRHARDSASHPDCAAMLITALHA